MRMFRRLITVVLLCAGRTSQPSVGCIRYIFQRQGGFGVSAGSSHCRPGDLDGVLVYARVTDVGEERKELTGLM
jgi:hypothetical protein